MREKLTAVFSLVKEVNVLDSQDEANLALLARPELGITFTKLHCWRLTQYEKCVFIDADTLVIRNCDELFEREELSAAPDVGWPDCFNSGVFVFKPSQQTFASLTAFATSKGSFDGGDQGLLNLYFSDWAHKDISKHLPFIYNMCSTASYSYLPAYKQFGSDVRIIHFIGSTKPWLQYFDTQTSLVHPASDFQHLQSLLQLWWNIFCEDVHPQLSPVMLSNEYRDPHLSEITSTLARREHNLYVPISPPSRNTISSASIYHECHTSTDSTYDEVDKIFETGFCEFKDPWDSYVEPTITSNSNYSLNHPSDFNVNTNSNDSVFVCEQNHGEFDKKSADIPLENGTNFPDSMDRYCNTVEISNNTNNNNYNSNNSNNENSSIEKNYTIDIKNVDCYKIIDEILNTDNFDKKTDLSMINDNEQVQLALNRSNNSSPDQKKCNFNFNREDQSNVVDKTENLVFLPTEDNKFNDHDHAYKNHVNSKPLPESYAERKNNENESQIHCTVEVESKCAGIAGALAKITLGEARSPEQFALEEHMRKQSWEQGQIDYMGRDSFDNIWKKICTTLSTVPETQKSTLKETIVADVKEKTSEPPVVGKTPSTEDEPAKEVSQDVAAKCHLKKSPEESKKSSEKSIQEISSPAVETSQAANKNEPILGIASGAPQLCIKESGETSRQPSKQEQEENPAIALGLTATSKDSKNRPGLKLDVSSKETSVRTVAESPVPIQVAESVLEADIKESVSEDIKPVTEEAISSISAPIQESISTVVETPLEPPPPAQSPSVEASPLMQPNGNGLDIDLHFINTPPRAIPSISAPEPAPVRRQAPIAETESKKSTETCSRSFVGTSSSEKTEAVESESSKVSLAENVVPEQVPKTTEEVTPEPKVEAAETVIETKPPEDPQTSASVPEEPAAKEQERPLPKELVIPGTPTIIEATPPTSPPLDVAACLPESVKPEKEKPEKKVVKKIVKKSSEEKSEESEAGEAKKTTKKVVKKVVKKVKDADDTGESSTSGEKPKKVVKVIKKTTKVQNLDAEASVPDTPPPASSQTPVPPKRKVKPATAKSSKKTDQDPAATP
ncbi:glycogenin 1 isoform X2 [Cotesia typhae]